VVQISPKDADARGIQHGNLVQVTSERGCIQVKTDVTDRLPGGVVHLYHGWRDADANALTDGQDLDPISGYPPFKSGLCEVSRV
jgi:anaerobic selenocysteine-containing dehydrogenase